MNASKSGVETSPSPGTAARYLGQMNVRSPPLQTWFRGLTAIVPSAAASNEASGGGGVFEALLCFDSSFFCPSLLRAKV